MTKSNLVKVSAVAGWLVLGASPALAHVAVKPDQVGVAAVQTFTTSVPNEKDQSVTGLRLIIPEGLQNVSPNVKPGWRVEVKKDGSGDSAKVTEISWAGGSIPAGQRDDFIFSAQVPDKETNLVWKVYQTFEDGTVTSWDQEPVANESEAQEEEREKTGKGPFSQTKVVNDLASSGSAKTAADQLPLYLSLLAVVIAGASLLRKTH